MSPTLGNPQGGLRTTEVNQPLVVNALTRDMAGSGGDADDNTAQGGHLVPIGFHMTQDPIHSDGGTPALGRTSGGMGVMAFDQLNHAENADVVHSLRSSTGAGARPLAFDTQFSNQGRPGNPDSTEALTGNTVQGVAYAAGVRRLTPTECEALQGLPRDWTAPPGLDAPDSRRYAAVGDACTVPVVQWIAERLLRYG